MSPISLFPPHHDPHCPPLRVIHRLDHSWNLVHECNGARNMIQHLNIFDLLPRHRHILQQLVHCMRCVLKRPQVHPLVCLELSPWQVSVVFGYLSQNLWRQRLFLGLNKTGFLLGGVLLVVILAPFASFLLQHLLSCWPSALSDSIVKDIHPLINIIPNLKLEKGLNLLVQNYVCIIWYLVWELN